MAYRLIPSHFEHGLPHLLNKVQQCITIKTTELVPDGNTRKANTTRTSQHRMLDDKNVARKERRCNQFFLKFFSGSSPVVSVLTDSVRNACNICKMYKRRCSADGQTDRQNVDKKSAPYNIVRNVRRALKFPCESGWFVIFGADSMMRVNNNCDKARSTFCFAVVREMRIFLCLNS